MTLMEMKAVLGEYALRVAALESALAERDKKIEFLQSKLGELQGHENGIQPANQSEESR